MKEKYQYVGVAVVIEDLPANDNRLHVMPLSNAIVYGTKIELDKKITLLDGTQIEASNSFYARWLPNGSNRRTPPNVTKGSRVDLFKDSKGREYFWRESEAQLDLRKLEEVTYMFSNRREGSASTDLIEACSYILTVSTLNKTIRLDTSDNDGEACAYTINLDTQEGLFVIEDSLNNLLLLNSPNGKLYFRTNTAVLTQSEYEKKHIKTEKNTYIEGNKKTSIDGEEIEVSGSKKLKSGSVAIEYQELLAYLKTLDVNVSDDVLITLGKLLLNVSSSNIDIVAQGVNILAPMVSIGGNLNVSGGLVTNAFSIGGATPPSVSVSPSKAKSIDIEAINEMRKDIIGEFFEIQNHDEDEEPEVKTLEKSEDPKEGKEPEAAKEEQASFNVATDSPITIESKAKVVIKTSTGSVGELVDGIIDVLMNLNTPGSIVSAAPGSPAVVGTATSDLVKLANLKAISATLK